MTNNKELKALSYTDNLLFQITGNDTDKIHKIVCSIMESKKEESLTVSSLDLMNTLRIAFNNTKKTPLSKNYIYKRLTSIPLLLITDVGSLEDDRVLEQAYLSYILQIRCENKLSTTIITSFNMESLEQFLGEDVVDSFRRSWKVLTFNKKIYKDKFISSSFDTFTNSSRSNQDIKELESTVSKHIEKKEYNKRLFEEIFHRFLQYTAEDFYDLANALTISGVKNLGEFFNVQFDYYKRKQNEKLIN